MIDGKTKVCGILANPVEHTMSPLLQNFYAKRTGINLTYVPFKVEKQELMEAVRGAYALNLQGLNVTVPHKESVMEYLVELDETAKAIGAVNTLVRVEGGFKGYNTDASGLLRAMQEEDIEISEKSCILIGAGGAAKAAAYILAREGAAVIYVLNRNLERARELSEYINGISGRDVMIPMALSDVRKLPADSYLAVQTTSVGMDPDVDQCPIAEPEFYSMIHTAVDVIYTPFQTQFMKRVKKAGGKAYNGLNMLLYQGVNAFELWNPGVQIDSETLDEARSRILSVLEAKRS